MKTTTLARFALLLALATLASGFATLSTTPANARIWQNRAAGDLADPALISQLARAEAAPMLAQTAPAAVSPTQLPF